MTEAVNGPQPKQALESRTAQPCKEKMFLKWESASNENRHSHGLDFLRFRVKTCASWHSFGTSMERKYEAWVKRQQPKPLQSELDSYETKRKSETIVKM